MNRLLFQMSRIVVGIVFIASGLIKLNDPVGFGYKLQEYFEVFHCTFLSGFATPLAIFICSLEVILGGLTLLGFWRKTVTQGLLILTLFFTFLTFFSAFFKVVSACGCFGDAIPLTPWQSFGKDVILLSLIVFLFVNHTQLKPIISCQQTQKIILGGLIFLSLGFGLYTYYYLPLIDFLPYKVGNNLPQLMKMPPGAPTDVYELTYTLKNQKTGESKRLSDKAYLKTQLWKNPDWKIVGDPETKLIKKGYEVKIKDLKIIDSQAVEYTTELIENPYYSLLVVVYDLEKTNLAAFKRLNAVATKLLHQYTTRTVLLTASSVDAAETFRKKSKTMMDIFYADAIPLKSMVRANPGILLLKKGVVINKWHYHNFPSFDKLSRLYFEKGSLSKPQ